MPEPTFDPKLNVFTGPTRAARGQLQNRWLQQSGRENPKFFDRNDSVFPECRLNLNGGRALGQLKELERHQVYRANHCFNTARRMLRHERGPELVYDAARTAYAIVRRINPDAGSEFPPSNWRDMLKIAQEDNLAWIFQLALEQADHQVPGGVPWREITRCLIINHLENSLPGRKAKRVLPAVAEHLPGLVIAATSQSLAVTRWLESSSVHHASHDRDGNLVTGPGHWPGDMEEDVNEADLDYLASRHRIGTNWTGDRIEGLTADEHDTEHDTEIDAG